MSADRILSSFHPGEIVDDAQLNELKRAGSFSTLLLRLTTLTCPTAQSLPFVAAGAAARR